jgi:2-iminobutanoate/2-iminopropanoate deaminase
MLQRFEEVGDTCTMSKPIASYSPFRRAGSTVYCSGQIPLIPETGELLSGTIAEQVHQAIDNLEAVLSSANATLGHVVKTTVFLIDPRDYDAMDQAYRDRFEDPLPAREAVFVAGLPKQARVEISAIACD